MHFNADMVQRPHSEIEELCKEMRESIASHSRQFEELTYEQGVVAAIRWLFFKTGDHPSNVNTRKEAETVKRVQADILEMNRAQAREGSDA